MDSTKLSLRELTDQLNLRDEKIIEDEKIFRSVFCVNPIPLVVTTCDDGKYVMVNDAFCDSSGYSEEEVLGKTSFELNIYVNDKDRKKIVEAIKREGITKNIHIQFRRKNGEIFDNLISTSIITIDGINHFLSSIFDITYNKNLEDKLKKERDKYQNLIEDLRCVVFTLDVDGNFVYISPQIEQLSDYKVFEIIGKNFLVFVYKEDWPIIIDKKTQLTEGVESSALFRVVKKNGELIRVETKSKLRNNVTTGIMEMRPMRRSTDKLDCDISV